MAQQRDKNETEKEGFFELLKRAIGSPVEPTLGTSEPQKDADYTDTQTHRHTPEGASETPSDTSPESSP